MSPLRALGRGGRIALLATLVLGACQDPGRREPLRIGINTWPGSEFLYLAQERGYFAAAGLPVRLVEFSSLGDLRRSFERGQIDGMATTVADVHVAHATSQRRLEVILATDYSAGSDVILSRVPAVSALAGRRVGLEHGSLGVYLLARALEESGLGLGDVRRVYLDQTEMPAALASGEVDAVVTYPPVMVQLLATGRYHLILSSSELPREILDVVVVDAEVLAGHPGAVSAMRRAWAAALAEARARPKEAFAMMSRREQTTAEEFSNVLLGLRLVRPEEQPELFRRGGAAEKAISGAARVLVEAGSLRAEDTAAAESLLRAVRAARP